MKSFSCLNVYLFLLGCPEPSLPLTGFLRCCALGCSSSRWLLLPQSKGSGKAGAVAVACSTAVFPDRGHTRVLCFGSCILNRWAIREVLDFYFIVDQQWCVRFRYSQVTQLYMCLFFFKFFPHVCCYGAVSSVPCAIEQVLVQF